MFGWKSVDELMEEGYNALLIDEYEEAEEIGRKLIKKRHSSGFEILGVAQLRLDKLDDAIATFEEGVKNAPIVPILWKLLGDCVSDRGEYDRALECYDRALACDNPDVSLIKINAALVQLRMGDAESALQTISEVDPDDYPAPTMRMKAMALRDSGAVYEALETMREIRDLEIENVEQPEAATCYAFLAELELEAGNTDQAIDDAKFSIGCWKKQDRAQTVLREIRNEICQNGFAFRLLIEGRWHERLHDDDGDSGFLSCHNVVADSEEEALEFIREIEPPEVADSLRIEKIYISEKCTGELKGVISSEGNIFFPWETKRD